MLFGFKGPSTVAGGTSPQRDTTVDKVCWWQKRWGLGCLSLVRAAAGTVTLPSAFGIGRGLEPKPLCPHCLSAPIGLHLLEPLCSGLSSPSTEHHQLSHGENLHGNHSDQGGKKLHERRSWSHTAGATYR